MAKTRTPSKATRPKFRSTPMDRTPKAKAPKKKAPTELEKRIITLERRAEVDRVVRKLQSRRISNLSIRLNSALDKLASPTVAVEEIKPKKLKAGDWAMVLSDQYELAPSGTCAPIIPSPLYKLDPDAWIMIGDHKLCYYRKDLRPATPEEIAAHEAKEKAEAQAAEDAKLVFGARVKYMGGEARLACEGPDSSGSYLLCHQNGDTVMALWRKRNEFTLLP